MKTRWMMMAGLVGLCGMAQANSIVNGDFQLGNTGFSSDYIHDTTPSIDEGRYAVVEKASDVHGAWTAGLDHTLLGDTGGLYFVANGSEDTSKVVWQMIDPIEVTQANTAYRFEGWITSVYFIDVNNPSPELTFQVGNGADWFTMGTTETFPNGYTPGQWRLSFYDGIFATTGQYYVRLMNSQSALGGNDLGIDDLYFGLSSAAPSIASNPVGGEVQGVDVSPIPEPATALLLAIGGGIAWLARLKQRL